LEAFAEQLVDVGATDVSVERVAKAAGVSLRTVYHHFPTREALFDGVSTYMDEKHAAFGVADIVAGDDLTKRVPMIFEAFDEYEMPIRAQLISEVGRAVRDRSRSRRRETMQAIVERSAPGARPEDIHRVTSLVHYLTNSEAWRSLKDESGMTGREAGETVAWAIEVLLAELKRLGGSQAK
jgi:AcrR family transcriptional regulator